MNLAYTLPHAEENIIAGIKLHTMRDDPKGRWKAGNLIHHCTGLRSKAYRCFLLNTCTSTQTVLMVLSRQRGNHGWQMHITVDRKRLNSEEIRQLWINDGFPTYTAFREWFFPATAKGIYKKTMRKVTLIHWTDFKY